MTTTRTASLALKSAAVFVLLSALILLPAIFYSCKEEAGPTGPSGGTTQAQATVSGKVYGKLVSGSVTLLRGATVVLQSTSQGDTAKTDSAGYRFAVQFLDTATTKNVFMSISKGGFFGKSFFFGVQAGQSYARSDTLGDTTSFSAPTQGSGRAASLVFISSTNAYANVRGVGGIETVSFTFEARDSLGIPVDASHRAKVSFQLADSTGGGEYLVPVLDSTGISGSRAGRVVTTLNSGRRAGIDQIRASILNTIISATSPAFPIYGGPADLAHFSMGVDKLNFPALDLIGVQNKVTVQIGDKAGNPVRRGTLILFGTSAGIIQSLDSTDDAGHAQAILTSGSPQPADGFDTVTAKTAGDSSKIIQKNIRILWSGTPVIDSVKGTDTSFNVRSGGLLGVSYRVYDRLKHPLAQGTHITVTVIGDAASRFATSGDLNAILPETQDNNYTKFHVLIQDTSAVPPSTDKPFYIVIDVTGPNGTAQSIVNGTLRGAQGGPGAVGKPASIVLASANPNQISVKGSGGNETSVITFLVMDRNGRTVPQNSALVRFKLSGIAGVTLFPDTNRTDFQGRVQTTVSSGTLAGVVQVTASADTGGALVTSSPVPITIAGGLPDSAHFTLAVAKFNVPGLVQAGLTDVMTAYVGDKYANPVQDNTAIYFTTSGGIITPTGLTKSGITSSTLITGDPPPRNGIDTITALTIGKDSVKIREFARVIFSGFPVIQSVDSVIMNDGSTVAIHYSVTDFNNNPLSSGTTIVASLVGDPTLLKEFQVSGDLSATLADNFSGGYGVTEFTLTLKDTSVGDLNQGPFEIKIAVSGPNGSSTRLIEGLLKPSTTPQIQSIAVKNVGDRRLNVKNTGTDSSIFVFEIQDNQGRRIPVKGVAVDFISSGAAGTFSPPRGFTDDTGRVKTIFYSGTDTGSVGVQAQAGNIFSTPQNLLILPGPPAILRLTMTRPPDTTKKVNFPGAAVTNSDKIGEARVVVTDMYGNPVTSGTQVDFSSPAGKINSVGFTNRSGFAKADWYGGLPSASSAGGLATVKAIVGGVGDSAVVTYSDAPLISLVGSIPNLLRHGLDTVITYTVKDTNGNPLAQGTSLHLAATGSAASSIIIEKSDSTLPDTKDKKYTTFAFRLSDTNTVVTDVRELTLTLQVSGPNGTNQLALNTSLAGAVPPPFGILTLTSMSTHQLSVRGVGNPDTSAVLTYQLQDSSHRPVRTSGVNVSFRFFGIAGRFSPLAESTDVNGQVTTTFFSDIVAEDVKMQAQANGILSPLDSILIQGGPPAKDFFRFTLTRPPDSVAKVNFPGGFQVGQDIGEAIVRVKDRYGNIVPTYTPIFFKATGGIITGTAYTDESGTVRASWRGGNPVPLGGNAKVVATASGDGGTIGDSAQVVYSGPARIVGGISGSLIMRHGIDTTITYIVRDDSLNPLAQGTTIQVVLNGDGASSLALTGDKNVVLPDTRVAGVGTTSFKFRLRDTSTTVFNPLPMTVTIQVDGPNGSVNQQTADTLQGRPSSISTASIVSVNLLSASRTVITVKNVGEDETSLLTYEIRDSLGRAIPRSGEPVAFSSIGARGTFTPSTASTDANGRVSTTFRSDTVAGNVNVRAAAVTPGIFSSPLKLSIVGGPPDQSHFTVMLSQWVPNPKDNSYRPVPLLNFPGAYRTTQLIGQARTEVGDKYGNQVPSGTPIYFNTNAGVIGGEDTTNAEALAVVDWNGGNPLPALGVAVVKAYALGQNGVLLMDSSTALYTGQPHVTGGLSSGFLLRSGIDTVLSYKVADVNGNPLSQGAFIQIFVSGPGANSLVLSGDTSVVMNDTRDTNDTRFFVHLRDTNTTITGRQSLDFSVQASGPNGPASQTVTGTLQGLFQTGGRTRFPGSVALLSASPKDVQVIGTGGTETSALVFEVRDSLGVPVDSSYRVRFSLNNPPFGTFISPDSGLSDPHTGRINAIVEAGSVAGVVQVVATVVTPTTSIRSTPVLLVVHAGLPDSAHFSINTSKLNVPGQDIDGNTATIGVIAGDKYGNPVAERTAVYFTTDIGIISASGFTNANGSTAATLFSANPRSLDGFGYARARTTGIDGADVKDSVRILFSGLPIIDNVSAATFAVSAGGTSPLISFKLHDENGNPLAAGTTITVTLQFTPPPNSTLNFAVTGDANVTLGDTQAKGVGTTDFSFRISDQTSGGAPSTIPVTVIIHVTGPNGTAPNVNINGTIG